MTYYVNVKRPVGLVGMLFYKFYEDENLETGRRGEEQGSFTGKKDELSIFRVHPYDNPDLTQVWGFKKTTSGLGVTESYTDINLYLGNSSIDSILLFPTHRGLGYTAHRKFLL